MVVLWALLLVQSQPPDTNEPRRGINRLLGLPCAQLDLECLHKSLQQWYADPYHFWLNMRERYFIVPPLFSMRFGETAPASRGNRDSDAIDSLMTWARANLGGRFHFARGAPIASVPNVGRLRRGHARRT